MEESEYTFSDDGESEHEVFLKLEELKYDLDNPAPIKLSPMKRMIDVINLMRTSDVTKDVLVHISQLKSLCKVYLCLFWIITYSLFLTDGSQEIIIEFERKLSKKYTKLMIDKFKVRNWDAFDLIPALLGYAINFELWEIFKGSRQQFEERQVFDVFILVYHKLQGLTITDTFIKTSIIKLFGNKFLHYTQKIQQQKSKERNQPYNQSIYQVEGGINLLKQLSKRTNSLPSIQQGPSRRMIMREMPCTDRYLCRIVSKDLQRFKQPKSILHNDKLKQFDCYSVSPLIQKAFSSSSTNRLQNISVKTPHSIQIPIPKKSTRLLRNYCNNVKAGIQKRLQKQQQNQERLKRVKNLDKMKRNYKLGEGISRTGVEHSPCLHEVISLKNRLKELRYPHDLFPDRL